MMRTIKLEFITPLFSHGATEAAEIRAPSIRGQLHEWFRLLGGTIEQERAIFGGIKQRKATFPGKDETKASKIVVRVSDLVGMQRDELTLPHKRSGDGRAAPRKALAAGTTCQVTIMDRLGGLNAEETNRLNQAINAWLLMGALGFRATRGGGDFIWQDEMFPQPDDPLAYQDACRDLLDEGSAKARVAVLEKDYAKAEDARRVITDSLGGPFGGQGEDDLRKLHEPLGYVGRRSYNRQLPTRKTSPMKYRVLKFASGYRILAFWDGREAVTGNTTNDFYDLVDLLASKKPGLGEQLAHAF